MAVRIEVVEAADEAPPETALPRRWRHEIGDAETQAFGGDWALERRSPLLVLPTALLPKAARTDERSVLLNPLHPDASGFTVAKRIAFAFDSRLMSA